MENNHEITVEELENKILDTCVSTFDSNYHRTRRLLVRQRFVLGLVQMFEKFPDLKRVELHLGENIASMVQLPQEHLNTKEGVALNGKIKKELQKTRAAICPQSRASSEAIQFFFGSLPGARDFGRVVLNRELFSRQKLPELCDPDMTTLKMEYVSKVKKELLEQLVQPKDEHASSSLAASPKM